MKQLIEKIKNNIGTILLGSLVLLSLYGGISTAATICFPYQGCTGTGTVPGPGKVLIGTSGSVYTPAYLTAGNNITITTSSGGITINSSGSVSTSSAPVQSNFPYWSNTTGGLSGTSTIFNLNGNIGINTTQPSSTLHVVGNSEIDGGGLILDSSGINASQGFSGSILGNDIQNGIFDILGQDGTSTATSGVKIELYGGNGFTDGGNGGAVNLFGGSAQLGNGGNIFEEGGPGGGAGSAGGDVSIIGGDSSDGNGGSILLSGGTTATSTANSGIIQLTPGWGSGVAPNGVIKFQDPSSGNRAIFQTGALLADRSFTFPDASGTLTLGTGTADNCSKWSVANIITDTGSPCGTSTSTGANPTATVGTSVVNGTSNLYMRADGAPAISTTMAPAMTGAWSFSASTTFKGPLIVTSTAADTVGTCGSSPSIIGGNGRGAVTTGSNASSTCTITFTPAFVNKPICYVTSETTSSINYQITPSSSTLIIKTASSSAFISNTIDYFCWGK